MSSFTLKQLCRKKLMFFVFNRMNCFDKIEGIRRAYMKGKVVKNEEKKQRVLMAGWVMNGHEGFTNRYEASNRHSQYMVNYN